MTIGGVDSTSPAIFWPGQRSASMLAVDMDSEQLAEVIARARRQEPTAFDVLINSYSSRLYGYFYRVTGSRHDAEDLLQEVFVRLVRMIGNYQHDGRFDGWLFRIATNLLRDRVRKSRRGRQSFVESSQMGESDDAPLLSQRLGRGESDPSSAMQRAEDVDRLQWAIDQLPEAEREVVMLRHFSELSFREIAELMHTPLGTALARAHRGLGRLRELMEQPESSRSDVGRQPDKRRNDHELRP